MKMERMQRPSDEVALAIEYGNLAVIRIIGNDNTTQANVDEVIGKIQKAVNSICMEGESVKWYGTDGACRLILEGNPRGIKHLQLCNSLYLYIGKDMDNGIIYVFVQFADLTRTIKSYLEFRINNEGIYQLGE